MNANAEFLSAWEEAEALRQQAERLYPRNAALQAEWIKAIGVVRSTTRGWVYDTFVQRKEQLQ